MREQELESLIKSSPFKGELHEGIAVSDQGLGLRLCIGVSLGITSQRGQNLQIKRASIIYSNSIP